MPIPIAPLGHQPVCLSRRRSAAICLATALLVFVGGSRAAAQTDGLLVLAAASLTDVLPTIAAEWSAARGIDVRFSFDATSRLAHQAVSSARVDVFVAADDQWMEWLQQQGAVEAGTGRVIAGNELVVAVPRGRSSAAPRLNSPEDLAQLDRLALAGENVPAGRYGREALSTHGLWTVLNERIVRGSSVRTVLEWIARGEVPAGIVYRTDAGVHDEVEVAFAFPPTAHAPIRYWAAPLAGSSNATAAGDFVEFLSAAPAAAAFRMAGFAPVPSTQDVARDGASDADVVPGPSVGSAIRLSLLVALLATLAGVVPAVGLGWLLARHDFRGKTVLSTAIMAPLVMPPVVTGFLLLSVFGTQGPVGRSLSSMGVSIPFSLLGAAIAAFVVGLPLFVLSVRGAFAAVDPLYEQLSWTLGVRPRKTFFRVSIPLALPGIAAGAILAFARALGEFGATVVLAGNVEGSTRTIALAVYTLLESPSGRGATWLLVSASVALSLLALLGYETLSRRQRQRLDQ